MDLIRRIVIDVYSDGSTKITEENLNKNENKDVKLIEEEISPTPSFAKYNLISIKKYGELYNKLQSFLPDQDITLELNGALFKGKIDARGGARITSLSTLYSYAKNNSINIEPGKIMRLLLDPDKKIIKVIII